LTRDLVRAVRFRLVNERTRVREAAMSHGFDEVRLQVRNARDATSEAAHALDKLISRRVQHARRRMEAAACRLSPARMTTHEARARVRLTLARAALDKAAASSLENGRGRLAVAAASLDALSPLAVLGRGYALAQDESNRLVRSSRAVAAGATLRVRLAEGALRCRVEEVEA
jgi:exodeoxyribonuclease VII large subunit